MRRTRRCLGRPLVANGEVQQAHGESSVRARHSLTEKGQDRISPLLRSGQRTAARTVPDRVLGEQAMERRYVPRTKRRVTSPHQLYVFVSAMFLSALMSPLLTVAPPQAGAVEANVIAGGCLLSIGDGRQPSASAPITQRRNRALSQPFHLRYPYPGGRRYPTRTPAARHTTGGPGAGTLDHGLPPRTHRLQAGTAIRWPRATPPRIPSRGRRNTGVPDLGDVPPAVAATGTTPACCPGPTAHCVRRRAAREAPFRNKRRSAHAGDAEADA